MVYCNLHCIYIILFNYLFIYIITMVNCNLHCIELLAASSSSRDSHNMATTRNAETAYYEVPHYLQVVCMCTY